MFFLIEFDNVESDETRKLQYQLSGQPNGTILSYACYIRVNHLPKHKWIVWLDKDQIYEYEAQYAQFLKLHGIKRFTELAMPKSPQDSDWKWEDAYIDNLFADFCAGECQ